MKKNMTYHAYNERNERFEAIIDTIGFGSVLFSVPEGDGKEICLTSTGVIIIRTIATQKIITAYVGSLSFIKHLYEVKTGNATLPRSLFVRVRDNQKIAMRINNGGMN